MKIQLIDSRSGVMKSIVLKEWMRIALSICLLGLPVILGYFSIQIVEARSAEIAKDSPAPSLGSEFDFSATSAAAPGKIQGSQALPLPHQSADATEEPPLAVLVSYGDMLITGRLTVGAASRALFELFVGFPLHKNGRLIDPASYIRSTIR
jgi:hypothetical protein